jgi:hypothetical protein
MTARCAAPWRPPGSPPSIAPMHVSGSTVDMARYRFDAA